jgi:CRP-like cAMP-binding protein/nucleotide-binding universal stress UspA family protein
MYQKVIVPLDGSREAEEVFNLIQDAVSPGGQIILLKVVPPAKTKKVGSHIILGSQQEKLDRFAAIGFLKAVARNMGSRFADLRCEIAVSESVSDGIVNVANSVDADLIAIYTHDQKLLGKHIKKSIAKEVQRKTSIEVRVFGGHDLEGFAAGDFASSEPATLAPQILKQVDVFEDLSKEQVTKVMSLGQVMHVTAGDTLGVVGEAGDRLYVILEGEAHLTTHSEVGEVSVRIAMPGEAFPLASLLGSGTLVTSAEALTDMKVLSIPRSDLLGLCYRDPELGVRVYASVARLFSNRYAETLAHVAISAERELRESNA